MEKNKILFEYIRENKFKEFINLLSSSIEFDVNIRDENGNYLITYAIIKNKIDIIEVLLSKKARIDIYDQEGRSILYLPIKYNYNDIITYSFTKDLQLQWSNVINKTTSDVETDNFLSFANMNAGAEIHFLFLQKDNNKQILSNHALQPNGSIIRYATLKSREAGYNFMPRLARQTGARQMIIPCIVRNNIAFAKIDF